jgi:hypothetical protein
MNKFKLEGNKLLNAEMPGLVYATFTDDLSPEAKSKIVATLNHGAEMLDIYESIRTDYHIINVVDQLKAMGKEYSAYLLEFGRIRRGNKK